jgi:DNA-binding transcriptional LysR family regulator
VALRQGFDAGIRYDESLEKDMVAVPIGPRVQRYAAAASPAYLARRGRPTHPRELLEHDLTGSTRPPHVVGAVVRLHEI